MWVGREREGKGLGTTKSKQAGKDVVGEEGGVPDVSQLTPWEHCPTFSASLSLTSGCMVGGGVVQCQ